MSAAAATPGGVELVMALVPSRLATVVDMVLRWAERGQGGQQLLERLHVPGRDCMCRGVVGGGHSGGVLMDSCWGGCMYGVLYADVGCPAAGVGRLP